MDWTPSVRKKHIEVSKKYDMSVTMVGLAFDEWKLVKHWASVRQVEFLEHQIESECRAEYC
mgnify:CR=1 FL=1